MYLLVSSRVVDRQLPLDTTRLSFFLSSVSSANQPLDLATYLLFSPIQTGTSILTEVEKCNIMLVPYSTSTPNLRTNLLACPPSEAAEAPKH